MYVKFIIIYSKYIYTSKKLQQKPKFQIFLS